MDDVLRQFTSDDIRSYAKRVMDFLADSGSVRVLESLVSDDNFIEKEGIYVTFCPSNGNVLALTISYIVPGKGIPLEVKLNPLGYSNITQKQVDLFLGYDHFATDPFGNLIQDKRIDGTGLDLVITELNGLLNEGYDLSD